MSSARSTPRLTSSAGAEEAALAGRARRRPRRDTVVRIVLHVPGPARIGDALLVYEPVAVLTRLGAGTGSVPGPRP
jgi:hypothetical protein